VAGNPDATAVAEVGLSLRSQRGPFVHLRLLPGVIEDYEVLVRRALASA
jgi:hypothetical protein